MNNCKIKLANDWSKVVFIFLSGLIYIFDQRLGILVGSNVVGTFLILMVALLYYSFRQLNVAINTNVFFILIALTNYTILSYSLNTECYIQLKGGGALLLFWLVVLAINIVPLNTIINSQLISSVLLLIAITFVLLDYFGIAFAFASGAKHAGIFHEASHLALYLLPLVVYRLLKSFKDTLGIAIAAIVFLCSPSTTFLAGMLLVISVSYVKNSRLSHLTSFVFLAVFLSLFVFLVISDIIPMADTQSRVSNLFLSDEAETVNHLNLSSIVWLNGWSQAIQTLEATDGFGVGFNQMGCGKYFDVGLHTSLIQAAFSGGMLNAEDGSLLSAKLIAEFGYVGLLLVILLACKVFLLLFKFINSSAIDAGSDFEVLCLRTTGAICLLVLLFVRSGSYFMLPVIISFSLLFLAKNQVNNYDAH